MSTLSQVATNPMPIHVTHAIRLVRYLKGTKEIKLNYYFSDNKTDTVIGYSDASYAKAGEYHSQGGYVIYMNNSPIDWKSNKQNDVAQSSFEAELYAMNSCTRRMQYYNNLLKEIMNDENKIPTIYIDANAAIQYAENKNVTKRNDHIGTKHQYIRQLITRQQITIKPIDTDSQVADIMTKQSNAKVHTKHRNAMMSDDKDIRNHPPSKCTKNRINNNYNRNKWTHLKRLEPEKFAEELFI